MQLIATFGTGLLLNGLLSPRVWLAGLAALCAILLMSPIAVAIGGYFWDLYLYPDAAWRIGFGQVPHVDFFAPAGAMEYYSYTILAFVFPSGNPLLLAQWSVLLVTIPLMAWTLPEIRSASRYLGIAIVLPFVFFSFVPLNTKEVYPLAGADGYGVYNRHVCLLMYVLSTALLFVRSCLKLAIITGLLLSALFFTKITGAVAGVILIVYAVVAGRMAWRSLVYALAIFAAVCVLSEVSSGIVSAYIRDILVLVSMNGGGIIARFRSPIIMYLDVLVPMMLLALLLAWTGRRPLASLILERPGVPFQARVAAFFDQDAMWLVILIAVGIFFETQNTGSLAFIFAWPYLAVIFWGWNLRQHEHRVAVLSLIALVALPIFMPMLHRTIRVVAATTLYDELREQGLGRYGAVEARPEMLYRAYAMYEHYGTSASNYQKLAEAGHQSSYLLYSEIDFQLTWLISAARGIEALLAWEAQHHRRLDRLIALDFVDIFTPVLEREPVQLISIGMAAERTVPPLNGERLSEAQKADGVLVPQCPSTPVRLSLVKTFEPVLSGRQRISLTQCWDLYIKP